MDTLIFPTLLGRAARVESTSPSSGQSIRITVEPAGVTSVEPATAVVSLVNPADMMSSIRSSFCNQVHYFTSPEDARPWLEAHPGGEVLPVADAYQLGATLSRNALEQPNADIDPAAGSCCH